MSEQKRIVSIVETTAESKTLLQKLLDGVETVGNKVPHPAVIFLVEGTVFSLAPGHRRP